MSINKTLSDGSKVYNQWLNDNVNDQLYHLGFSKSDTKIIEKFSQIKVIF